MDPERALLLIADIGGYTEYMRSHRMSLAHAEVNTARLLEKVIDAAPNFDLIEIEGDAACSATGDRCGVLGGPELARLDGGGQLDDGGRLVRVAACRRHAWVVGEITAVDGDPVVDARHDWGQRPCAGTPAAGHVVAISADVDDPSCQCRGANRRR